MPYSAATILLEYVAPILGIFVGNYMFYAPYADVSTAIQRGSLGVLNPLPWAFMLGNCIGWVLYSILVQNYFVFLANIFGLLLSVWFNMAASKLLYQQQFDRAGVVGGLDATHANVELELAVDGEGLAVLEEQHQPVGMEEEITRTKEEAPTPTTLPLILLPKYEAPKHDYVVMGMVVFWLGILSLLGFAQSSLSASTQQWIVGISANINLLYFYAAPLSTIVLVIQTHNTASIHTKTMVVNTTNAIFWTIYGFAVQDYFIFGPNGLGAILGFVQIGLYLVFPRATRNDEEAGLVVAALDDDRKQHEDISVVGDGSKDTQCQTIKSGSGGGRGGDEEDPTSKVTTVVNNNKRNDGVL